MSGGSAGATGPLRAPDAHEGHEAPVVGAVAADAGAAPALEEQVATWRSFVSRRGAVSAVDAEELEGHLRDRIEALQRSGLSDEEAFLIAVKRIGRLDELSREFAREHSDRLWKQLVVGDDRSRTPRARTLGVAVLFAVAAALWVKLPSLAGLDLSSAPEFFLCSAPVLFLSPVACYLLVRRGARPGTIASTLAPFAVVAVLLAAYPFAPFGMTQLLAVLHATAVLWLATGIAYADGRVRSGPARMDFIRFTGEWAVYVLLILVGGVLLAAVTTGAFAMIGVETTALVPAWIAPCGTAAALVVGAWLVEEKQSVIENIAPVLTRLFTPLFAVALLALVAAAIAQHDLIDGSRELLVVFDVVLLAAAALLLYSLSARDPARPAGWFEGLQLVMVLAALVVDAIVLAAMLGRIGEYGLSANKVASLGVNLLLLANLLGSAWLLLRFLRGRARFAALERWQTSFVPAWLAWAVFAVAALPPLFAFA